MASLTSSCFSHNRVDINEVQIFLIVYQQHLILFSNQIQDEHIVFLVLVGKCDKSVYKEKFDLTE